MASSFQMTRERNKTCQSHAQKIPLHTARILMSIHQGEAISEAGVVPYYPSYVIVRARSPRAFAQLRCSPPLLMQLCGVASWESLIQLKLQ